MSAIKQRTMNCEAADEKEKLMKLLEDVKVKEQEDRFIAIENIYEENKEVLTDNSFTIRQGVIDIR